jgi:hypothetical protein
MWFSLDGAKLGLKGGVSDLDRGGIAQRTTQLNFAPSWHFKIEICAQAPSNPVSIYETRAPF